MTEAPETTADMERVVRAYVKIRDKQAEEKKEFEKKHAEWDAKKDELEAFMLDVLNKSNAQSIATNSGTFYKSEKVIPAGADWGAFYRWVAEDPERFEFLERRIKATTVKAYMDENENTPPPGVNVFREYKVGVRRK